MQQLVYAASAAIALALSAGAVSAQTPQPTAPPAATQSTYTDAQLRAFAAASLEIDPISRALPSASAEQRTQAAAQIRSILERHQIDSATYNAIASRAQTDAALAQRIASLQVQQQHSGESSHAAPPNAPTPSPQG